MFYEDREVWEVGFWENKAKIAAQTITINRTERLNEVLKQKQQNP